MHSPLRIGVDMAAAAGQKSGLGFYVENIVGHMKRLPQKPELVELNTIQGNLRTPQRILWDQIGVPLMMGRKDIDLLFVPAFSAPRFKKPIVMTAHDIFGIIYPEQFSKLAKWYWTKLLPESMKRAEQLICVSEYTKQSIAEHLGIHETKMTVVPLAASSDFRVITDLRYIAKQLKELHINSPFILTVGTLEPRKNFERLIEAYAFTKRADVKLVIVGKKGWNYNGIFEKIRKYHLQNSVLILEYISVEQLVALYNSCLYFIMPSIFEGFGLPPLEAMQCGAAVAVSQNTSLPEVVGEAGVLFDPFDVNSMRERMDLLLNDENLRTQMQRKSLQRASEFSWERTAQETLDILTQTAEHA